MNIQLLLARCLIASTFVLALAGCSMFRGESKGTTMVNTSNGSLPIRREASTVVDLAQPTVVIEDENVIVSGNVRLRGGQGFAKRRQSLGAEPRLDLASGRLALDD